MNACQPFVEEARAAIARVAGCPDAGAAERLQALREVLAAVHLRVMAAEALLEQRCLSPSSEGEHA